MNTQTDILVRRLENVMQRHGDYRAALIFLRSVQPHGFAVASDVEAWRHARHVVRSHGIEDRPIGDDVELSGWMSVEDDEGGDVWCEPVVPLSAAQANECKPLFRAAARCLLKTPEAATSLDDEAAWLERLALAIASKELLPVASGEVMGFPTRQSESQLFSLSWQNNLDPPCIVLIDDGVIATSIELIRRLATTTQPVREAAWFEAATKRGLTADQLRKRSGLKNLKSGKRNVYRITDVAKTWPEHADAINAKAAAEGGGTRN